MKSRLVTELVRRLGLLANVSCDRTSPILPNHGRNCKENPSKHQSEPPNSKHQAPENLQIPSSNEGRLRRYRHKQATPVKACWNLEFDTSLRVRVWILELSLCRKLSP